MANLIDRINLVWLLRYRFNYKLPPAQVYYLLVGSRYSLPGTQAAGTGRAGTAWKRCSPHCLRHGRRVCLA